VTDVRTVCVYCASSPGAPDRYLSLAAMLGEAIARRGWTLLYGGGAAGLMGALADAALAAGGEVVGVRPAFISRIEAPHSRVADMCFTETMHERKAIFFERADAFVALPGAIGTLDELVETITWKRLGLLAQPICIVNADGFFDPLVAQLERFVDASLVARPFLDLFQVAPDIPETMALLARHRPRAAAPILWDGA